MRSSFKPLFAIATLALAVTACGFGDDRLHAADDVVDPVCGDGAIDPGEQCDDTDTVTGDGCDADCNVEVGWSCLGEPSDCVMGQGECGDGAIANGEECDDDNTGDNDGCSGACDVEAGWECSGSPSDCNLLCGNGHVDPGEDCDGGPDCDANCQDIVTTACTLVNPQTGCAANQACDLVDDDGNTGCRAVTTQGTSNNHCELETECAAGYVCLGDPAVANDTQCRRYCDVDSDCNGDGSRCLIQIGDANGDPIPGVDVCTNHCEPVTQAGCPSGQGCLPYEDGAQDFTDCTLVGTKLDGATCSVAEECRPGSLCVDDTATLSHCRRMCEVGLTCPSGGTCTGFVDPVDLSGVEVGVCL
jgi:large repetitive protein